jgi:hypothetical protein
LKRIGIIVILFSLICCGVSKVEYNKLLEENTQLKRDLEQYEFGTERTVGLLSQYNSSNDLINARHTINILEKYHPEVLQENDVLAIIQEIIGKENEERLRIEAEEKEKIRLENLGNTGIWVVFDFVDSFGEKTGRQGIKNRSPIKGTFSNSATKDSDAFVDFIIRDKNEIYIQLYVYRYNSPVSTYYYDIYNISMQDEDGNRYTLANTPENQEYGLTFNRKASNLIHQAFIKGGIIKFRIKEENTSYQFDISNAKWYENAYLIVFREL